MGGPLLRIGGGGNAPGRSLWLWCPACHDAHRISIDHPAGWAWDRNDTAPTISPSILVTGVQWPATAGFHKPAHATVPPGGRTVCHSFLTAGVWRFLPDCTHPSAGLDLPAVPLPDWLCEPPAHS